MSSLPLVKFGVGHREVKPGCREHFVQSSVSPTSTGSVFLIRMILLRFGIQGYAHLDQDSLRHILYTAHGIIQSFQFRMVDSIADPDPRGKSYAD